MVMNENGKLDNVSVEDFVKLTHAANALLRLGKNNPKGIQHMKDAARILFLEKLNK